MGATAASCLWRQPACHYDDSAAYQCRPQIYLSYTRLWPRLGPGLAPVHLSISRLSPPVTQWTQSLISIQLHGAARQRCRFSALIRGVQLNKCHAVFADVVTRSYNINRQSRRDALSSLKHCFVFTSTREKNCPTLLGLKCFRRDIVGGQLC